MIIYLNLSEFIRFVFLTRYLCIHCAFIVLYRFTPLGAGFLIVAEFLRDKSLMSLFSVHKYYFITLISALTVHGFIILPALYAAITRKNPCVLMLSVYHPLVVGYITSSRSAVPPYHIIITFQLHIFDNYLGQQTILMAVR